MSREIELLTEIRDLLEVIAEPALAQRDAKLRSALRDIVGSSARRAKAVHLMDGSRSQATIAKESGLDQGNISRLTKALAAAQLASAEGKQPKLALKISPRFFDEGASDE
jgi:regulator of protease activity HflC (stomatin/prohibitin superfamily)